MGVAAGIAYRSNSNIYYSFNVSKKTINENGLDFLELNYNAKFDKKIFYIEMKINNEQAIQYDEDGLKSTIIGVANQVNNLMQQDVISIKYKAGVAKINKAFWGADETTTVQEAHSEWGNRITSYSAKMEIRKEELERIDLFYQEKTIDSLLQQNISDLVDFFKQSKRTILRVDKKRISTKTLKQFIESFSRINDIKVRKLVLQALRREYEDRWVPCLQMILDTVSEEVLKEKTVEDFLSWNFLLDLDRSAVDLQQEFMRRGIDPFTRDLGCKGNMLIEFLVTEKQWDLLLCIIQQRDFSDITHVHSQVIISILEGACKQRRDEIVKELLSRENIEHVCDLNIHFMQAIRRGHAAVAKEFILSKKITEWDYENNEISFFEAACQRGNVEIINTLLEQGEDVYRKRGLCPGLKNAIGRNRLEAVQDFLHIQK
ncbi:MAG: ankyrin repeat domain-containing protein [Chlamydiota bacterium]